MTKSAQSTVPPESDAHGAGVKVLVVDDEPGIRNLLTYELKARGYQVTCASNGEQALELARKESFQLMISDVKMPVMDGLETLSSVKKLLPDVEVIMATAYGTVETAVSAMKMGAYDFIQKPFNLGELFALIEKALERRELKALVAIHEASKAVFASVKLDDLLPEILRIAARILGADEVSLMLVDDEGQLAMAAAQGETNPARDKARLRLGERVAGRAALRKEPLLIIGDVERDARFHGIEHLHNVKSAIVYPLVLGGETLGVLNANRTRREEPFSWADVQNATIFCSQIAQAVSNAKLYRELEENIQNLRDAYRQLEEAQRQLVQTEKLAAIGQLAAGVAHELNNPLTGILGFAQLLMQEEGFTPQQKEDLESIYKQSQRCRQIIQNLLQFSHRKEPRMEEIPLGPVLDVSLQLVQYEFATTGIEIEKSIPPDLPLIKADPDQLQQVFLNLLTNSRQAIAEARGRRGRIRIRAERTDHGVRVSVKDNGCGVSSGNLGRIFDPFFTTKPVGKGTGLGLSISYGIIQQHKGTIRAESTPGEGTTFTIELPGKEKGP